LAIKEDYREPEKHYRRNH